MQDIYLRLSKLKYNAKGRDTMNETNFTSTLRECRLNSGLTQKQIANALNVDRSTYAYYETGVSLPRCELIIKMANLLNVNYAILMDAIVEDELGNQRNKKNSVHVNREKIYSLTNDEKDILLAYRALPPDKRKNIVQAFESA